jgi:hypothetical protein
MERLGVKVSSEMLQRSVMPPYLVVNNRLASDFRAVLDAPAEKGFFDMLAMIMNEYLEKGK